MNVRSKKNSGLSRLPHEVRLVCVRLFYFSQTRGRMRKPDSQGRIRANGQTGPSGGTAAFRGWLVRELVQVQRRATAHSFKFATVSDAQAVVALLLENCR